MIKHEAHNEFNKFNNTEAQMLDFINHMTLKLLKNHTFGVKTSRFYHLLCNIVMDVITLHYLFCKPLVVYQFYCMALYHFQTQHHVVKKISNLDFPWHVTGTTRIFWEV